MKSPSAFQLGPSGGPFLVINQGLYRATFPQHIMHKTYNKSLLEGQFLLIFHIDKSIK